MEDADPDARPVADDEQILRAKYHDYCSAQLADLLLYLSPDEIYLLAEKIARDQGRSGEVNGMVVGATEWLARHVTLPPFEIWLEDYREHPRRYEEYFMGLWESELPVPTDG